MSRLFEDILRERYEPLDFHGTKMQYGNTVIDLGKDKDNPLIKRLKSIKNKPNWAFACLDDADDAFDAVKVLGKPGMYGNECFLILDNQTDEPIGGIKFCVSEFEGFKRGDKLEYVPEGGRMIYEIYLLGFKENNITLVRDVFKIFEEMRRRYPVISWCVEKSNPICRAYHKKVGEWDGLIMEGNNYDDFVVSDLLKEEYRGVAMKDDSGRGF
jgi:hypothetical protein